MTIGAVASLRADGIVATINTPEATIEDQLLLTLTIEGSRSAQPALPELPDFDVYPRGQSTQMSFVNGRVSSSVSHNYLLVPKRTGTLTIGPATVDLEGRLYTSQPIEVRIVDASEQPGQTRDLFISTKVSTTNPYVGQEVVYIWRFYRRVRIGDARLEPQDFSGFLVEDLGEVREYQATVNGVQYLVSEIRKALFPQEAGLVVLPASRLTCEVLVRSPRRRSSLFDDFFGTATTETKVLRGREIELEVRALPPLPPGFSGLVGSFDIDAQISKAELEVGESATLRLTVSGHGNVQMISQPRMPELSAFKVYDDKPQGSIERSGARLSGSRTFSKALVPLQAGELAVPPVSLTYFDPDAGEFREVRTATIPLRVSPGDGQEELHLTESVAPTTGKVAVRILADDLLPIYKRLDAVRPSWPGRMGSWMLLAGLGLPPLAFAGIFVVQRRRRRFAQDTDLRRRHQALRQARGALREISLATASEVEASQRASRILRQYIGDKLGVEGSALTAVEVDEHLRTGHVDEELVRETHALLERLEAAQYGASQVDPEHLLRSIEELLKRLERQIK